MQYKAMDERGRTSTGEIDVVNVADLELRLGRMGLDLINSKEISPKTHLAGGRIKRRELISFCFHLEQLVSSGVPMLEGLADLRDSAETPRLREIIATMMDAIEGGKTLSDAMEDFPQVFDNVFVNLVRAGESSGQLGEVLRRITENLKWIDETTSHVRKLFMYPLLVGTVVILVIFFLMIYLVPQLVSFIETMGQELPAHTRFLIAVSDFVSAFWYAILLAPIVAFIVIKLLAKTSPSVHYALDSIALKLWVVGPILKKIILSRFANYFALMYASGITVLDCMRISEKLVGNRAVEEATRRAGRQIADGASISAGFEYAGLFPPLVLRMLRVGESTGALESALMNVSYFYDRDVRESIQRLQTMIEPAMTFILGGLLVWVMVSVLGPIYDLITKIQI